MCIETYCHLLIQVSRAIARKLPYEADDGEGTNSGIAKDCPSCKYVGVLCHTHHMNADTQIGPRLPV